MENFDAMCEIYHGSNLLVKSPRILVQGFYKDFGFGFYCTKFDKQAVRWALTKRGTHFVNVYVYHLSEDLKIKRFSQMDDEWLDFVASCRMGIEHDFDIVEGPMADDTIWNYVEDFILKSISREAFWELAKYKYPTHQIVFCTENALKTISFKSHYTL